MTKIQLGRFGPSDPRKANNAHIDHIFMAQGVDMCSSKSSFRSAHCSFFYCEAELSQFGFKEFSHPRHRGKEVVTGLRSHNLRTIRIWFVREFWQVCRYLSCVFSPIGTPPDFSRISVFNKIQWKFVKYARSGNRQPSILDSEANFVQSKQSPLV